MASARVANKRKKRATRATSNVFAMFDEAQITEFKEAFAMIDQDHDGYITENDLREIYSNLGKEPSDAELARMISEAPSKINFTMFLTLFGERMTGTDPEDVIKNAFACFDPASTGSLDEQRLRELLTTMGDRLTDEDVDDMLRGAPVDNDGNFNYVEFTRMLKNGAKDESA